MRSRFPLLLLLWLASTPVPAETPLGTAFTYQGQLTDLGSPANGPYDFEFRLFDSAESGNQVGSPVAVADLPVSAGVFTTTLDFGDSVFTGSQRWLEIRVRPGASNGGYTLLFPLQELTAAPNAVFASTSAWSGLTDVPAGFADGVDDNSGGDITSVLPGTALSGGGASGAVSLSVEFAATGGEFGTYDGVARSDHIHDSRYTVIGADLVHNAVWKVNNNAPTLYAVSEKRYIVEATPASVGVVVTMDNTLTDQLCRDKDGCEVTLQMVNWDVGNFPGLAASRTERLFISETSRHWRFSNIDVSGLDNNATHEYSVFDCYFTDAENYTGVPNGRLDSANGFALLNIAGGAYSDATTTCRVIMID
jgi:hypothetical protein